MRDGLTLPRLSQENLMNNIIYIVGLIVVIIAVLSFFGLR
jgi:small-conductance mechanosensitive channel